MNIRPYRPSDLEQVKTVYHDAVHVLAAPYYSQEQLAAWAPENTDPDRSRERLARLNTIVMDADGVIAGFASYEANGHLDLLFTRPEFARRGVATVLCERVEKNLAEAGVRKVFAEVSRAGRPFFEARGFRVVREETVDCRGVGLQRFAMEKPIKES